MKAAPVHLVDRKVSLASAAVEIVAVTPQLPVHLPPGFELLEQLNNVHA